MIQKSLFGKLPDGREVNSFIITNKHNLQLSIITYGAIVTELLAPDHNGELANVVLGYDTLEGYIADQTFIGSIVGRYGNRIAKGKFSLLGKTYTLACNNGVNHLHGGNLGFNKVLWQSGTEESENGDTVTLTYHSADGEEGYPGNLDLTVKYTLTDANEFKVTYSAITDATTIINPTHHSYFNLSGIRGKKVTDHILWLNADAYLPGDEGQIPTGEIASVKGTPMDFLTPTPVGQNIDVPNEQLQVGHGYDHSWALNDYNMATRLVATLFEPTTHRYLEMFTDQPGLQFYSGNFLTGESNDARGKTNLFRTGLCLEAQHHPDSPNKPAFPSTVLNPGETYTQETIYKFSVK